MSKIIACALYQVNFIATSVLKPVVEMAGHRKLYENWPLIVVIRRKLFSICFFFLHHVDDEGITYFIMVLLSHARNPKQSISITESNN